MRAAAHKLADELAFRSRKGAAPLIHRHASSASAARRKNTPTSSMARAGAELFARRTGKTCTRSPSKNAVGRRSGARATTPANENARPSKKKKTWSIRAPPAGRLGRRTVRERSRSQRASCTVANPIDTESRAHPTRTPLLATATIKSPLLAHEHRVQSHLDAAPHSRAQRGAGHRIAMGTPIAHLDHSHPFAKAHTASRLGSSFLRCAHYHRKSPVYARLLARSPACMLGQKRKRA